MVFGHGQSRRLEDKVAMYLAKEDHFTDSDEEHEAGTGADDDNAASAPIVLASSSAAMLTTTPCWAWLSLPQQRA